MALTLEQYADYLDTRRDLSWPAPPAVERPKAKPYLVHLPEVRAVTWSIYGTLVAISGGELYFQHPQKFIMEVALEKTIQEFKMWKAMTRKPGKPSEYMAIIYDQELSKRSFQSGGGERYPEVGVDKVWEAILKKLLQNEYSFDVNFYGSLDDYSRKVAFFFHSSMQGTACYPGAAKAIAHVQETLGIQGLLADAQCFTLVQLARGLAAQKSSRRLDDLIQPDLRLLSYETKARKPSEWLFRDMLSRLQERGLNAGQVLHVGSSLANDIVPARRLGMRTALFAGDKAALQADPAKLKEPKQRPDVLLTELRQIKEVVG